MLTDDKLTRLRRSRVKGRNRLRAAMELAAVTQVQLADHLDCTQVYVSTLVRGDYKDIPLETTRRCAEYFGCAIEDLFPRPQTAVTA